MHHHRRARQRIGHRRFRGPLPRGAVQRASAAASSSGWSRRAVACSAARAAGAQAHRLDVQRTTPMRALAASTHRTLMLHGMSEVLSYGEGGRMGGGDGCGGEGSDGGEGDGRGGKGESIEDDAARAAAARAAAREAA